MRFTVSSTALSSKLNALAKVINSKNSLPILADFLFDIQDNVLYLTASDSENVINTQMELTESDANGRFAINNHDLLEAIKGFSEQPITFDVNLQDNIAKISYQNGLFSLPVENADEYPQSQPITEGINTIVMPSNVLADNINRSLFATAQDELRPVMNGIYFDLTPEHLAVVASDGHKLVRNKVFTVQSEQPASFILPKKPAGLLKNLLQKDGGDVEIKFNERNAEINYGDGRLSCRLIEGRYPNYNSVIPQNNTNTLTVDRLALLAALRRVQPFANDSSNLIRFHVEGSTLQLDAEDFDFSKTATERMICDYNGQPMSIGFKGSAFIEILTNFDCEEVIIQLADPSRAGLVIPSEQPEGQDVLMLMMPMLLND
ncbi:DNA polymerase III subunit beta [Prevotella sp. P3-120]|uniref:Beta sliding clamp n=1 Tax=Xylanibacter brevis TaxID=83231 RepID=A0ABS9CHW4_9BACT|nr:MULTISPECIES: DNA polymerase III subunit beta [Prevotellaceae]MBS7319847.1 DNA polymerase III subunit beta [Prevotella sp.]MCF2559617.1 DNA polymerase III subunit beta [Xylanibacter brevis]MCF2564327.1 DNA polymerase III subunit beta [Xylanibacter brevis]MCI7001151.1 DNA polymerase III subunit beta [Prevotella sp.]MDD7171968.1 DNA polymerase III subunit beta [Prevotella sp.]